MKKELLSPAGNIECAYAAINNGADAIYLSGKSFGARSFADNFTDDELKEIVNYAHLVGVFIYVTVNTLIEDENIDEVVNFIRFLHEINVDAVILQDIGLANIIHNKFPNLEIHSSTQMHNIDKYSVEFLENLGFSRVVLARELSLDEINKIETNLQLEAFIHGSLCISYSGQCLFSSLAMNRSGNLGSCSQLCRMPYTLKIENKEIENEGKYLLSPKDLGTYDDFKKIMESNILSLKIEGRMKSSAYVALVTRMYRKLIDGYYDKKEVNIEKEKDSLKYLFNRGITKGHILNSENILNTKRQNHQGVSIGNIIEFNENYITIKLTKELRIKDGIKFANSDKGMTIYNLYINKKEVKEAFENDIITIPNKVGIKENEEVLKTFNDKLNTELLINSIKKNNISITVNAKLDNELEVIFTDNNYSVNIKKSIVEKATNKETTKEDIEQKITKLGNTSYVCHELIINKDECIFIRLSDINEARRELVEKLNEKRIERKKVFLEKNTPILTSKKQFSKTSLAVYVKTQNQLDIVKKYPINKIYTDNIEVYENNQNYNIYYEVIDKIPNENIKKIIINNTSQIQMYQNKFNEENTVLNYTMNIYNSYTIEYLKKYGLCSLSVELNLKQISKISKEVLENTELLIYGKPRVMNIKQCIINGVKKCGSCCDKTKNIKLIDSFNRNYYVECKNSANFIYNHKPILKIRDINDFKRIGIKNYRIDFLDEDNIEINKILKEYFN